MSQVKGERKRVVEVAAKLGFVPEGRTTGRIVSALLIAFLLGTWAVGLALACALGSSLHDEINGVHQVQAVQPLNNPFVRRKTVDIDNLPGSPRMDVAPLVMKIPVILFLLGALFQTRTAGDVFARMRWSLLVVGFFHVFVLHQWQDLQGFSNAAPFNVKGYEGGDWLLLPVLSAIGFWCARKALKRSMLNKQAAASEGEISLHPPIEASSLMPRDGSRQTVSQPLTGLKIGRKTSMKRLLVKSLFAVLILGCTIIGLLVYSVKRASDEIDTVTDASGKSLFLPNVPGDRMRQVEWVKHDPFDLQMAVVSEALERTITPARRPCNRSTKSLFRADLHASACSIVTLDLCASQVRFIGFVQRGPAANEVVGSSIDAAALSVYRRYGADYVIVECSSGGPIPDASRSSLAEIVADARTRYPGQSEPESVARHVSPTAVPLHSATDSETMPKLSDPDSSAPIYQNARYGFSLAYPSNFKRGKEPDNGDGLSFTSQDGHAHITSFGSNTLETLQAYRNRKLAEIGKTPEYAASGSNWFALSWISKGRIFYMKCFQGTAVLNEIDFDYPENQAQVYKTINSQVVRSFHPGTLNETP